MRCVIVSCCGLPAAGKTTFCRRIVSDAISKSATTRDSISAALEDSLTGSSSIGRASPDVQVTHICFDEYIYRARLQGRGSGGENSTPAKTLRQKDDNEENGEDCQNRRKLEEYQQDEGERDGTGKQHVDGKDNRDIETPRVTPATVRGELPESFADSEVPSEDDPRWWHDGRRAALARIECLAAQLQADTTGPTVKIAPVISVSQHLVTDTAPSVANEKRSSQNRREMNEATHAIMTTPALVEPTEVKGSAQGADMQGQEVVCSAKATVEVGAIVSASTGRDETSFALQEPTIHVVLADDNMHFRSMRYELFRLARKYGSGYAQVYFSTDVEVAVERNKTRHAPVDEAVIRKMALGIQPPDPERFKWEQHTTIVGSQGFSSPQEANASSQPEYDPSQPRPAVHVDSHGRGWNRFPSRHKSESTLLTSGEKVGRACEASSGEVAPNDIAIMRSFWQTITSAAECPIAPVHSVSSSASPLEQDMDRQTTRASLLHQFDLELRESVRRVAETTPDIGLTRDVLRTVMSVCSSSRKRAIHRARAAVSQHETKRGDRAITACEVDRRKEKNQDRDAADEQCESVTAASARDGKTSPVHSCLLQMGQFISELEEALSTVDGLKQQTREKLVEAARGPAAR